MKRRAIYAGSFDPVTYGHLDLIKRGLRVFDELIVGITDNPQKRSLFTMEERVQLLKQVVQKWPRVKIESFNGLLVDYAKGKKATVILRGLRAVSDFEYEFQMALTNRKLSSNFETVYMMPSEIYSYVSSHLVKQVASLGGRVKAFVPPLVEKALREKFKK